MSNTATLKAVATGTAPAEAKNPVVKFKTFLEGRKAELVAALPRHVNADRMIRLACTEFAKNPKLQECTPVSVYGAIIQSSQLGLEIGVLGQAYLVPFKKSIKLPGGGWESRLECQLIPGYKGLIGLARRSGEVTSIETHIVYDRDTFNLTLGIDSKLEHVPYLDGDRGLPKVVYGVAKFKDGGHHLEWMSVNEVFAIRDRTMKKNGQKDVAGPWKDDQDQMIRKTLIRRMANYLPMSVEMAAAVQMDAATSEGRGATIDGDFIVHETEVPSELDEQPSASQERPPASEAPALVPTFAQIEEAINQAGTLEELDVQRSIIKGVQDEQQQAELNQAVSARVKAIKGGK